MRKPSIIVVPQARVAGVWQTVPVHRAQQWAVLRQGALVGRYATKRNAESVAASEAKRDLGPERRYALGRRMAAADRRSLDLDNLFLRSL